MADLDKDFDSYPDLNAAFDALPEAASAAGPRYSPELKQYTEGESFGKGIQQGGTFGFADEIGALFGTLGAKSGGDERDMKDVYEEIRNLLRAENKQAEEQNPYSSIAGNVVGSIPSALLVPTAAAEGALGRVAQAAKAGGIGGAIGAAGTSEANLAQGDVGDFAKDVAMGGALGVGLGAGGQGLGEGIGKTYNYAKESMQKLPLFQDIKAVYDKTKAGKELFGTVGEKAEDLYKYGEDTMQKLSGIRNKVGAEIESAGMSMDNELPKIDISNAYLKAAQALEDYAPSNDQQMAVMKKINSLMDRATQDGAVSELLPSEVIKLRQEVNKLYKSAKDGDTIDLINSLKRDLLDPLVSAAETLETPNAKRFLEANKNYRLVDTAQAYMGLPGYFNPADTRGKIRAGDQLFDKLAGMEQEGGKAARRIERGLGSLENVSQDLGEGMTGKGVAEQIKKTAQEKAEDLRLASEMSKESYLNKDLKTGFSTTKAGGLQAARLAGKMAKSSNEAIIEPMKKFMSEDGASLARLANIASQTAKPFAKALASLTSAPMQKRKALMYSLMQQPAFREFYEEHTGEGN